ncbi:MAG TPA: hypothetical protein EYP85_06085 [Armatimonadetes bacterium]|nr:hypothetical protein [Armatimonadota bacterium]
MDAEYITLTGAESSAVDELVNRLAEEDILGQLLRREGRLAELATEDGDVKLDWVDGVEKALVHPEWLMEVEREAADIVRQGIRRVIWAGMGGSVQTIYALRNLGYLDRPEMSIHPLDSTDPASLNRVLTEIAAREKVPLADREALRELLRVTMMIGVSMGLTSEEPITHLEWFDGLLHEYNVPHPEEHIQVMTLPHSYLDQFARPRGSRLVPIQLDGENHTPGRMSAPATRVFLRPVALMLMAQALATDEHAQPTGERVRAVLARAQELYQVSQRMSEEERQEWTRRDAFLRWGAFMSQAVAEQGRNKVLLLLPPRTEGFAPWLEQLVEESLGKGGKGFLIFYGEPLREPETYGDDLMFLQFALPGLPLPEADRLEDLRAAGFPVLTLHVPLRPVANLPLGLGELAGVFSGTKLAVAAFGYLQDIVFAGQPAVEAYKKYARDLRESPEPVPFPTDTPYQATSGSLTLYYNSLITKGLLTPKALREEVAQWGGDVQQAADVYAAILSLARRAGFFRYADFTFNGELTPELRGVFEEARRELVNGLLHLPGKIRTGPSDYHSTEQSETDGPPELVSTRLVALQHAEVLAGTYSHKFLLAQARGTWQAMEDADRWILMITLPAVTPATVADLRKFFRVTQERLSRG